MCPRRVVPAPLLWGHHLFFYPTHWVDLDLSMEVPGSKRIRNEGRENLEEMKCHTRLSPPPSRPRGSHLSPRLDPLSLEQDTLPALYEVSPRQQSPGCVIATLILLQSQLHGSRCFVFAGDGLFTAFLPWTARLRSQGFQHPRVGQAMSGFLVLAFS